MVSSREQLISQDIAEPEKRSAEPSLEIAKTKELENAVSKASELAEAIEQDKPVEAEQVLDLDEELGNLKVIVGGEEMTVEQARKIPDLSKNLRIWEEIRNGIFFNESKLTYVTTDIARRLLNTNHVGFLRNLKPTTEIMKMLRNYRGDLWLPLVRELSDEEAEILGQHVGRLYLNGLEKISTKGLDLLLKHRGHMELNSLMLLDE